MDKRTLIFLFLLTISFFFIHSFFSKREEEKFRTQLEMRKAQDEAKAKERVADQGARTISFAELPLVKLYSDEKGQNFVAYALDYNNALIAIIDEPADALYAFIGGSTQKVSLVIENTKGRPVVYGTKDKVTIPTAYLPQVGMTDLQIVSMDGSQVSVTLGEYTNGRVIFPIKTPEVTSIALYEMDGRYLPVGYYDAAKKSYFELSADHHLASSVTIESPGLKKLASDETFYVLESSTQQVVFSNVGGSIVEINLPFESKEAVGSVVKPIGLDREIEKQSPQNATFPTYSYQTVSENGELVQKDPAVGGYYPLLRRGKKGMDDFVVPPRFYSLNIQSEDPRTSAELYKLKSITSDAIEFEAVSDGRRITKRYQFSQEGAPYVLELSVRVDGDSRGLWINTGVPEVELISGSSAPTLKYRQTRGTKASVEKMSLPKKESTNYSNIQPDWVSNSNGFFSLILDPLGVDASGIKADHIPGNFDPTRLTLIDAKYNQYPATKFPGYDMLLPLPATNQTHNFRLFAGPLENNLLKTIDAVYSNPATGYNPSYKGAISFHGWFSFISEPFAKFLFYVMSFFYQITHSWGFSIILLTVVLRLMLFPLNAWSFKSNYKMQSIQPKVTALQQKYKKDPTKVQLETMQLYKEHGVNPFSGCLPLLIQMPFLIGMFDLLKSTFELRGASFIPGWIDNLTAPDVLFSWNYPIIFFGTQFHLLPLLLGVVMFFQQRFMSAAKAKGPQTDQQKQMQMMNNVMPILFTFMFYRFPSGLNLYWISSMSLSLLQQKWTAKKYSSK